MAQAAKRRFAVSKPWGETRSYDVGIEHGENFLRVQVKSASRRVGGGYFCRFTPHYRKKQDYTLKQIDLFAAYVIPVDKWYLIPASVLLGTPRIGSAMLSPVKPPAKKASYCYECYRDGHFLAAEVTRREIKFPHRIGEHGLLFQIVETDALVFREQDPAFCPINGSHTKSSVPAGKCLPWRS
jgi:hypothetical protein